MSNRRRTLEELNIIDDFLMAAVAEADLDFPRHNRFYQARVDSRYMNSGERDFRKLPNLFVITITPFDPFGQDYMMYTVKNRCLEVPELPYEDGLQYIYFNTKGTKGGTPAIQALLRYFQDSQASNATDEGLQQIHECVSKVRILPEVKDEFMMFEDYIYYKEKAAAKEAIHQNFIQSIQDLLEEYGVIPESLLQKLEEQEDSDVLRKWIKLAAKATSIEDFEEKIEQA